tara:strand:+ start:52 stop:354 length:303 start_codon:yes stop_codon:yes gene_type:complete
MKKVLFIMIALFTLSTTIYASFPVTDNVIATESSSSVPAAPAPSVDWGLAAACFFLGGLGIHRFMMGDITNGILMLLTGGGCGIWALIDFINILSGKMYR